MTALAVLTVLAVVESTLPSSCLSYKIPCQEMTVTVLTVLAVFHNVRAIRANRLKPAILNF